MDKLRRISGVLDIIVFAAATFAIAGVFYEGMTLKWYDIVGILVICMDYSFIPATIIHLVTDRNNKSFFLHLFSLFLIAAAVVMKISGMAYPAITLLMWYFYIWFLYGGIIVKRYIQHSSGGKILR